MQNNNEKFYFIHLSKILKPKLSLELFDPLQKILKPAIRDRRGAPSKSLISKRLKTARNTSTTNLSTETSSEPYVANHNET